MCPLLVWLDKLPTKVQDKCIVRIERLAEKGHELRRPEADFLRDGIYELRTSFQNVNYRMLYFFHRQTAVISHGLTKDKQVPDRETAVAIRHRELFEKNPAKYTYEEPDNA
jgi:phage-related protein